MKDKPPSNMLECDEADLDYLCKILKEKLLEADVLRNTIRLIETFRITDMNQPMQRLMREQVEKPACLRVLKRIESISNDEKYRQYINK